MFDQIALLPDPIVGYAMVWITNFLRMCARRNIKIWINEGTPKHDRKQNQLFVDLMGAGQIPVELKYFDQLTIYFDPDFGTYNLFIPDEWSAGEWASSTIETQREVKVLMAKMGLEKVDFTYIHGAMKYQLPESVKQHTVHEPEFYESITRYHVNTGHIHTPEHRGRILTNGSFDRLNHGEEHAKGHWRIKTQPSGDYNAVFVENKGAMIYRTVRVLDLDADAAMAKIHAQIAGLPNGSHVRLWAEKGHPVFGGLDTLKKKYPHYHFSTKTESEEEEKALSHALTEEDDDNLGIEITRDNVISLVNGKLTQMGIPETLKNLCLNRLHEDVHGLHA
jgi:hypothetical protein